MVLLLLSLLLLPVLLLILLLVWLLRRGGEQSLLECRPQLRLPPLAPGHVLGPPGKCVGRGVMAGPEKEEDFIA
jgi:hypothetical protein